MIPVIELWLPGHPAHGRRQFHHYPGPIAVLWTSANWATWTAADDLWLVELAPTGRVTDDGLAEIVAPTAPLPI